MKLTPGQKAQIFASLTMASIAISFTGVGLAIGLIILR